GRARRARALAQPTVGVVARNERDDAPAETGASQARTQGTVVHARLDERIQRRRRDLEVVAEAGVAGQHERAECTDVTGPKRSRELQHTRVLGDDVPRTRVVAHLLQRRVAQRSEAEAGGPRLPARPAAPRGACGG